MKKVLCFGDSNTYGFNPQNGARFGEDIRWTGQLKEMLKAEYMVIEAGANNRCCFSKNPEGEELQGLIAIEKYLELKPEIVILAIGINDLQKIYFNDELSIYNGVKKIINKIKEAGNTKIILLIPSILKKSVLNSFFNCLFDINSIEKSKLLPYIYKKIAKELNILYIDLNEIAETSNIDGLHYDKEGHKKISNAIINLFKNSKI